MENITMTINVDSPLEEHKEEKVTNDENDPEGEKSSEHQEEKPKDCANEEQKEVKSIHFDTLVLSGGSTNIIMTLGALQHLYDESLHHEITTYIGTSSGAMIGYLIAIGYTPLEIMLDICTKRIMDKLQFFDMCGMINGIGACSFSIIQEQLEKMTISKIGTLLTLKDLHDKYNRVLICTTYNMTKGKCEYLSHTNYPNLPCLTALRMSSNLPLVFEPYKYEQSFYIDGAICDNFPIDVGDRVGKKVLGILLSSPSQSMEPAMPIVEYVYKLIFIPINDNTQRRLENISDKCKIVRLITKDTNFFKFNLTTPTMLNMFSFGYRQFKDDL
jgi:predicted acylesterase/phospholipase RssA